MKSFLRLFRLIIAFVFVWPIFPMALIGLVVYCGPNSDEAAVRRVLRAGEHLVLVEQSRIDEVLEDLLHMLRIHVVDAFAVV